MAKKIGNIEYVKYSRQQFVEKTFFSCENYEMWQSLISQAKDKYAKIK